MVFHSLVTILCSTMAQIADQWKAVQSLVAGRPLEKIQYFCHCTSPRAKAQIESQKKLQAFSDNLRGSLLARKEEIEGVWFILSLFKGSLPTISPYGSERIRIRTEDIIADKSKWRLFFEDTHHYGSHAQYIKFVLVKKSQQRATKWCEDTVTSSSQ